jgi:hypothetical protein
MASEPDASADCVRRLEELRNELDSLRAQIDKARHDALEHRKLPERRVSPRPTADRRRDAA